jgi:hypothetical protein
MFRGLIPVFLLAALAACGGVTDPSQNQNQTFNGTVQVGGASTQQFSVSKSGEISAVVTSFNPVLPSGTLFGVAWGQLLSGQCSIISLNQFAVTGATVVSSAVTPGTYCISIIDEGLFKVNEDYVLTVSHP